MAFLIKYLIIVSSWLTSQFNNRTIREMKEDETFVGNYNKDNNGDQVPMCVNSYSLKKTIQRKVLKLIFMWILFVRSFFLTQKSAYVTIVALGVISSGMAFLSQIYPSITGFTAMYFQIYVGVQLIVYDELGSRISNHVLNNVDPILSVTYLTSCNKKSSTIKRFFKTSTVIALVLGRTPMTPTGRAALFTGVFTGVSWLYNERLNRDSTDRRADADREAANRRASADREAANKRAEADREFEAWKLRYEAWRKDHEQWSSSKFTRRPEPVAPIRPEQNL